MPLETDFNVGARLSAVRKMHHLSQRELAKRAGVTNGTMLKGVRRYSGGATTHSVVMRSRSGTVRYIDATHNFDRKTGFDAVDG